MKWRPNDWYVNPAYWRRPTNADALWSAVRWAAGGKLAFGLEAPEWIIADPQSVGGGATAIHLLNYRLDQPAPPTTVNLRWQSASPAAVLYEPGHEPREMRIETAGGSLAIPVPAFETYAIVLIQPWRQDERIAP